MSYRNKKLLRSAEGQACVLCGSLGTTVSCHVRSVELGSGTGIKAPDFYVAHLCELHHAQVDGRSGKLSRSEQMEMWTRAYLRTVARWFDQGVVIVRGDK